MINILCFHLQEWQNSIQKNAGLAFIELVNEGRWVSLTCCPLSLQQHFFIIFSTSTHQPLFIFIIPGARHCPIGPQNPQGPSLGGCSRLWTTINDQEGVWEEWGWQILEFKAPFNTCWSQRDLGKGEGLGRRWQCLFRLVSLWHLGNGSWFPTIPLSLHASLVEH